MSGASCVAGTNLTPHQLRNFISTTHQGPGVHALCGVSGNFPGHFNRAEGDLPSHPGVHTRDATFWQLPGEESVADSHGFTVNMGAHVLLFAFFFFSSLYPESCDYPRTFPAFIILCFNLHNSRLKLKNKARYHWEGQKANNSSEFHLN